MSSYTGPPRTAPACWFSAAPLAVQDVRHTYMSYYRENKLQASRYALCVLYVRHMCRLVSAPAYLGSI
jgi:hypothetical protein